MLIIDSLFSRLVNTMYINTRRLIRTIVMIASIEFQANLHTFFQLTWHWSLDRHTASSQQEKQ